MLLLFYFNLAQTSPLIRGNVPRRPTTYKLDTFQQLLLPARRRIMISPQVKHAPQAEVQYTAREKVQYPPSAQLRYTPQRQVKYITPMKYSNVQQQIAVQPSMSNARLAAETIMNDARLRSQPPMNDVRLASQTPMNDARLAAQSTINEAQLASQPPMGASQYAVAKANNLQRDMWQSKPEIRYYQDQVSAALNSLYNLYTNRKCDQCDGNCRNYLCYGCGGCSNPPPEQQTYYYPYQRQDAGSLLRNITQR